MALNSVAYDLSKLTTKQTAWICIILLTTLTAQVVSAAAISSSCQMKAGDPKSVTGTAVNERLAVASVSKVMTSWWAVSSRGLNHRFETLFHVIPLEDGRHDVHIQGSRDPYFGKESLHFAISELNNHGVKNVRNLTFDENFKFFRDVTASSVAQGFYTPNSPSPTRVLSELNAMGTPLNGYGSTYSRAKSRKIDMVRTPQFTVEQMVFKSRAEASSTPPAFTFAMGSATLQSILKEMNRNSNNHAANQIFEHLGGATAFQTYVFSTLELDQNDLLFLNGSGDRVDLPAGKAYNEASCAATLKIIDSLRLNLEREKKQLEDVLAVIGRDTSSTAHRLYRNSLTTGSVMAKTGTVNPAVTLGGMAYTKTGRYVFMINAETTGGGDWATGRGLIRTNLIQMMRKLGGGKPIRYSAPPGFLSFDEKSKFQQRISLTERR